MSNDDVRDPALAHRESARRARRRRRRVKPEAEIVLLCNPRAGGRWRELAGILDSVEARSARRIVTDSVEDVASALGDLEADTKLICVYGGDGTVQRVLDRMTASELEGVRLALLGGGTMNVTSRWLGFSRNAVANFRHVVRAYRSGELLHRELPILEVQAGDDFYRCFTFGMGPIVRLLDAYERGNKGKIAALGMAARAVTAAWLKWPDATRQLLEPMRAGVVLDGEPLPYDEFTALFANVTGQINPGVEPFAETRTRDSFYVAAYAVSAREIATALPMLIRGWLPVDVGAAIARAVRGRRPDDEPRGLPKDPRYVNRVAGELVIETEERLYTVDGEVLEAAPGASIRVTIGPSLKLAVGPGIPERVRLVAETALLG
jgi:hypothetical protein